MPPHSEPKRLSLTEEDYLKAIYHLSENAQQEAVSTNDIARRIEISAASVSDMLKSFVGEDWVALPIILKQINLICTVMKFGLQ